MTAFGEMSITSITLFYVLLSVPLSLMRCTNGWAILSNRSNPSVILLIRRDFTFMPSLPLVILRLPSNISDAIWGVL